MSLPAPPVVYTPPSAAGPPDDPPAVFSGGTTDLIPHKLIITGITNPADSDPMIMERINDSIWGPQWSSQHPYPDGEASWILNYYEGKWLLKVDMEPPVYQAEEPSTAPTPVGLTFDIQTVGNGSATVAVHQWPADPPAITT